MIASVAVIVLNWNNAPDTLDCLHSLSGSENCQVHVVDNGSEDDSVARIRANFPEIPILQTATNLGYAGGNNAGIRRALATGAEAICILNNDTVAEPGFLAPLLAVLEGQPVVGIVTPLVAEECGDGLRVWALGSATDKRTAAVKRQHAGESAEAWRRRAAFEVEIASGSAMLVRPEVFERVGLLDEGYFLYYEEADWCLRVRKAGYRILAVPTSVVQHKVSATLGPTSPIIDYYMTRNQLRFIARNSPGVERSVLFIRTVLRVLLAIAAYTGKSHGGLRTPNRNAKLLGLRDALLGRWGQMGPDVAAACGVELA